MRFNNWFIALLLLGAAAGAMNCEGAKQSTQPTPPDISRRQLQRQAMRSGEWRFVYCLDEGSDEKLLKELLYEIANDQPFGKRIEVVNCHDLTTDTLGTGPVTVFGNRIPVGAEGLPLKRMETGWTLENAPVPADDDVLFVPYLCNPWTKNQTVAGFYVANDISKLVARIRKEYSGDYDRMFWPNWAYELYRVNGDRVYGNWADTTWQFDESKEVTMTDPETPVYDQEGLKVFAYDGNYSRQELIKSVNALRLVKHLVDSLAQRPTDYYPEVRLYPNLERVGLRTGSMNPIQFDAGTDVMHLVPNFLTESDILSDYASWQPFIDYGFDTPIPEDLRDRLITLLQYRVYDQLGDSFGLMGLSGVRLNKHQVLSGGEGRTSQLLSKAAMINYVLTYGGCLEGREAEMIARFRKGNTVLPGQEGIFCGTGLGNMSTADAKRQPPPNGKLAGMTFAHEGYRVHNGYGGEKIVPSLDSLAKLNVNALAIVPYTFQRNPEQPAPYRIGDSAGGENDWAVTRSIREAHSRGWFVLLKPQIWVGGGHWPGDIDFGSDEDWEEFFQHYTYWIVHYALLAEREGVGALCLGTEMVQTTLKHPDRWRKIIKTVRQVYGGQLTYAANWGEEFEGFTFWQDLDAIGLNSYYPTSKADNPTDEELVAGAKKWFAMAATVSQKADRPLWLTEVGYRSVAQTWTNPHADPDGRATDDEAQRRAFTALVTAAGETPELQGMFVWKWPSYLGRDSYKGASFTPGGKPAAKVLGDFYKSWK